MRRTSLYSSSRPAPKPSAASEEPENVPEETAPKLRRVTRTRRLLQHRLPVGILLLALLLPAILAAGLFTIRPQAQITQKQIDEAVANTLKNTVLPSPAAKAYEAVRPAVVRVTSYTRRGEKMVEDGVGTGVMIIDKGVILTNMHVVVGSDRLLLTFADGTESDAYVTGIEPEQDLAVLQAHAVPEGAKAATLQSSAKLAPGDHVFAVGFPFGIGPSVSAGVVSGLNREYLSPEGKRVLSNLIQFDTAANPGNSGGPLVTADGRVVGIVTGILNPTSQRVFIGIGFAVPIETAAPAAGMPPF